MQPWFDTRPTVGRNPVTPFSAAGMRMEPPVSVPSEISLNPAATAEPEPPLEPPGMASVFHGLRQAP